ncbi:MAG: SDR family oxidoreductase [Clostridia bacterium]|nr:SDR family oxidoreductase [Clostridia bacterium]
MRFSEKTALITGAAVGIGRACAILFAREGANVVLIDLDKEKLAATEAEIRQYTDKVLSFECNVTDEPRVYEVVSEAEKIFGGIDILVNNAAIWRLWSSFTETSTDDWRKYLDINIMGVVYFTKAVLPKMLENSYGRIINVASVAGVYGNANMVHYSATKGALISMTKALAKEVSSKGVLVNSVSPGSVSPSDCLDIDHTIESDLSFMGRTGSDRENAELICFLASDAASYISGQNIQIDGCRKKQ